MTTQTQHSCAIIGISAPIRGVVVGVVMFDHVSSKSLGPATSSNLCWPRACQVYCGIWEILARAAFFGCNCTVIYYLIMIIIYASLQAAYPTSSHQGLHQHQHYLHVAFKNFVEFIGWIIKKFLCSFTMAWLTRTCSK